MNKTAIEANHSTKVEHKIVFYIDGQKYGFRCYEEFLNDLETEDGGLIPLIDGWEVNLSV